MRIPYGFDLTSIGSLAINENEAETVRMIFGYYLAGASLGKVVDMLYKKQIPSPTGKVKWTRAAVDHLLSNSKYIAIVGFKSFTDAQFEKTLAVISIMTRPVRPVGQPGMSRLLCSKYNFYSQSPQYLLQ